MYYKIPYIDNKTTQTNTFFYNINKTGHLERSRKVLTSIKTDFDRACLELVERLSLTCSESFSHSLSAQDDRNFMFSHRLGVNTKREISNHLINIEV